MKRLFIAINLPEDIKETIKRIVDNLKNSVNQFTSTAEIRFLAKENWHLTISFLGYQSKEAVPNILKSIESTLQNPVLSIRPKIEFEKFILAPIFTETMAARPPRTPRMIWLVGSKETSKNLGTIKTKLEDGLIKNGVRFKQENREFNCHLTLARFKSILKASDISNINKKLSDIEYAKIRSLSFVARSLDLMESHLSPLGAKYKILAEMDFI